MPRVDGGPVADEGLAGLEADRHQVSLAPLDIEITWQLPGPLLFVGVGLMAEVSAVQRLDVFYLRVVIEDCEAVAQAERLLPVYLEIALHQQAGAE